MALRASRDVAASNSTAVLQAKAKIDESKLEPISIRNKKKNSRWLLKYNEKKKKIVKLFFAAHKKHYKGQKHKMLV